MDLDLWNCLGRVKLTIQVFVVILRTGLGRVGTGPGCKAQSAGHLTRKSGVLGSIPSLATYFRFSLLIQEGQLSVTGKSMCMKYWLTACLSQPRKSVVRLDDLSCLPWT